MQRVANWLEHAPVTSRIATFLRKNTTVVRLTITILVIWLLILLLLTVVLTVTNLDNKPYTTTTTPVERQFFIAAEEVEWDYAPYGFNRISGEPFSEMDGIWVTPSGNRIGSVYTKAVFREYYDANFTKPKPRPGIQTHMGLLGPPIYAEPGDTIVVYFMNKARFPFGMYAEGVSSNSEFPANYSITVEEGSGGGYEAGRSIPPNGTYTYVWNVPTNAIPSTGPNAVLYFYFSQANYANDIHAGLIGPLVVVANGQLCTRVASPDQGLVEGDEDVQYLAVSSFNTELFNLYMIIDENRSPYLSWNMEQYLGNGANVSTADPGFVASNRMHAINGYVFGNMPGLKAHVNDQVRWYLLAAGDGTNVHAPHVHGQVAGITLSSGEFSSVTTVPLTPGITRIVDMPTVKGGTWLVQCQTTDHIQAGMLALFTVDNSDVSSAAQLRPSYFCL